MGFWRSLINSALSQIRTVRFFHFLCALLLFTHVECRSNINNIPLDPTNEHTYDVLKGFLMEMTTLFPDEFLHLGGDEVR